MRLANRLRAGFMGNVLLLSGGSAVGQAIALVAAPVISRLYSPSDLGALGAFASALSLVSVVAALRYECAVPAASTDREAADALALAACVSLVLSVACAVLLFVAGNRLLPDLSRSLPRILGILLAVGMAATALYQALTMWMIRRADFSAIGRTRVTQSVTMTTAQVTIGVVHPGPLGLVIGQILGSCGGLVALYRRLVDRDGPLVRGITRERIVAAAYRYRRFPQFSAAAVLLDTFISNAPLLFVASHYGLVAAGLLTLVQRWLFAPINLFVGNVGQVFFSDLARTRREHPERMGVLLARRVRQQFVAAFALVTILAVIVPPMIGLAFGARWAAAGGYFLLLTPFLVATTTSSPFGCTVDVLHRQDLHLMREMLRAIVLALALGAAKHLHSGVEQTLVFISGAAIVNGVIYLGVARHAIRQYHEHAVPLNEAAVSDDALANASI